MSLLGEPNHELLMVGIFAETYRVGNIVKKVYRRFPDDDIATEESIKATHNEANIYILLGDHPRIAKFLHTDPAKTYIELEYYPNGNLKNFIEKYRPYIEVRKRWARQIVESAEYIHTMSVRHSDFRLEQWLLDETLNARLSDFNASGYDRNVEIGLEGSKAIGAENANHFMPRDHALDNTVESDLFALGSTLYELITGKAPYEGRSPESVENLFREGVFPGVDGLPLGDLIMGCWVKKFRSAKEMLKLGERAYEL
jgi:serine/threonine protein kinase